MHYVLFDGPERLQLLPFTFTRPMADLRMGILTIRQKWEHELGQSTYTATESYLQGKYPMAPQREDTLFIRGSVLPNTALVKQVQILREGEGLFFEDTLVAYRAKEVVSDFEELKSISLEHRPQQILHTWELFSLNQLFIEDDFERVTRGRESAPLSKTNTVIGNGKIFLEPGAKVECAVLNTTNGPIYIGRNAEVMEMAAIRGGFALGENSVVKMGAKVYGPTTVGPFCKIGGEVTNSVLFGHSNKGHEGYLGNSVLGEWCNMGADSNTSNLKNNYAPVRLWDYGKQGFAHTGLQFCGLMMGDHSKCGINTMFNTGTVVGVNANIFGSGYPRNFIPSFSWGGAAGFSTYRVDKSFEAITAVMARRNMELSQADKDILEHVFQETARYRTK